MSYEMRVGDLVRLDEIQWADICDGKPAWRTVPSRVAVVEAEHLGQLPTWDGVQYKEREVHPLTVADAFAYADFPVPEGAKIIKAVGGWGYTTESEVFWFYHCESFTRWDQVLEPTAHWRQQIDLSRLPVADCFECLPEVVKKALTEDQHGS